MGAYLCIASNTVPPSVSKRIRLNVNCKHLNFHIFESILIALKSVWHAKILLPKTLSNLLLQISMLRMHDFINFLLVNFFEEFANLHMCLSRTHNKNWEYLYCFTFTLEKPRKGLYDARNIKALKFFFLKSCNSAQHTLIQIKVKMFKKLKVRNLESSDKIHVLVPFRTWMNWI